MCAHGRACLGNAPFQGWVAAVGDAPIWQVLLPSCLVFPASCCRQLNCSPCGVDAWPPHVVLSVAKCVSARHGCDMCVCFRNGCEYADVSRIISIRLRVMGVPVLSLLPPNTTVECNLLDRQRCRLSYCVRMCCVLRVLCAVATSMCHCVWYVAFTATALFEVYSSTRVHQPTVSGVPFVLWCSLHMRGLQAHACNESTH